jgi:hypothetical protein
MKTFGTSFFYLLLLLALAACGEEQIGTSAQSHSSQADPLRVFEQLSCSNHTLIKPKVDILYVVDNSQSTYYVANDIRTAIRNTANSISKDFDYRLVGTALLPDPGDASPFDDYQVLTNSQDPLSTEATSRKVISSAELNFFTNPVSGSERGLNRMIQFIERNRSQVSPSLFRQNAYLLIVLVSNGRDVDVEYDLGFGNGETGQNTAVFNARKSSFQSLRQSLQSQQLRLFSVTAKSSCSKSGWLGSEKSYIQMSKELYLLSGATDNGGRQDWYDLCGSGLSEVFTAVNNSIKQVVIPHTYRYWPVTFADNAANNVSTNDLKVYKVSGNSAPALLPTNVWNHRFIQGGVNTRILPTVGEFHSGSHFVEFTADNYITYPDCVLVQSVSKTEFFGYIVLPREPRVETLVVKINGQTIPQSTTNGWSYVGHRMNQNVKMPHPNPGDENPAVVRTGFMIQLNGASNYYKTGDNVEANYIPAGI